MKYFTLRNGIKLSAIGLGTYPMKNYQIFRTVPNVYKAGVNLIDTAHDYKNERMIGIARKFGNKSPLISTKMSVSEQIFGGGM